MDEREREAVGKFLQSYMKQTKKQIISLPVLIANIRKAITFNNFGLKMHLFTLLCYRLTEHSKQQRNIEEDKKMQIIQVDKEKERNSTKCKIEEQKNLLKNFDGGNEQINKQGHLENCGKPKNSVLRTKNFSKSSLTNPKIFQAKRTDIPNNLRYQIVNTYSQNERYKSLKRATVQDGCAKTMITRKNNLTPLGVTRTSSKNSLKRFEMTSETERTRQFPKLEKKIRNLSKNSAEKINERRKELPSYISLKNRVYQESKYKKVSKPQSSTVETLKQSNTSEKGLQPLNEEIENPNVNYSDLMELGTIQECLGNIKEKAPLEEPKNNIFNVKSFAKLRSILTNGYSYKHLEKRHSTTIKSKNPTTLKHKEQKSCLKARINPENKNNEQNLTVGSDSFHAENLKIETSPQAHFANDIKDIHLTEGCQEGYPYRNLSDLGIISNLKDVFGTYSYLDLVKLKELHTQYAAQKKQEKTSLLE